MKTHWKIGLIASLIVIPIALIASSTGVFAAERISDSELATLYGGWGWFCDQDCEDSDDGACPKEIPEFEEGQSADCDNGCGSSLEDCVGACPETKDEECGDWHTQIIPGSTCNDNVPDVSCQSGSGTYTGWCQMAACGVQASVPNPPSCTDCKREDCVD